MPKPKRIIVPREVYRRFKRTLTRAQRRIGVDFEGVARLIMRSYRILAKFVIELEHVAELCVSFLRLFGIDPVRKFIQAHPDWILESLKLTGQLAAMSLITLT